MRASAPTTLPHFALRQTHKMEVSEMFRILLAMVVLMSAAFGGTRYVYAPHQAPQTVTMGSQVIVFTDDPSLLSGPAPTVCDGETYFGTAVTPPGDQVQTTAWVSAGPMEQSVSTTKRPSESADDFAIRHRDAVARMARFFPPVPPVPPGPQTGQH